jgi:hypothetical protein
MGDLHAIARQLRARNAFSDVVFPYRDGDRPDVLSEVRLRQSLDAHSTANFFKSLAIGATLFLLSPLVGPRLTEIHDVQVRNYRAGRLIGEHVFEMRTDVRYGYGADRVVLANDLDAEQMSRIASRLLELITKDWYDSNRGAADGGLDARNVLTQQPLRRPVSSLALGSTPPR